jgi:hypothetical protein
MFEADRRAAVARGFPAENTRLKLIDGPFRARQQIGEHHAETRLASIRKNPQNREPLSLKC